MKFCFGGVLICKTKEQAKRVAFDNSVRRKAITLEGDVYDPAGWSLTCLQYLLISPVVQVYDSPVILCQTLLFVA